MTLTGGPAQSNDPEFHKKLMQLFYDAYPGYELEFAIYGVCGFFGPFETGQTFITGYLPFPGTPLNVQIDILKTMKLAMIERMDHQIERAKQNQVDNEKNYENWLKRQNEKEKAQS